MSLESILDLRYEGGVYADPDTITDIGRVLKNANSRAVANSLIVSQSPSLLCGFTVSSIAAQFIQIYDASAVPAEATVPLIVFSVPATSVLPVAFVPYPRSFRNGIVICNSSTQHTKTIGSADCIFDVQFV